MEEDLLDELHSQGKSMRMGTVNELSSEHRCKGGK